jgi:hypothetical protein
MRCLPLWQPWASLVAVEAKRIETRHWPAPSWLIGHRIAIHATKTKREMRLVYESPFADRLMAAVATGTLAEVDGHLPFGAIVCTAVIDRCSAMTEASVAELREREPDEYAFGLYRPGRFAMVLRDVERLAIPVPFRGRQGKFFDVPDELLGRVPAQGSLTLLP